MARRKKDKGFIGIIILLTVFLGIIFVWPKEFSVTQSVQKPLPGGLGCRPFIGPNPPIIPVEYVPSAKGGSPPGDAKLVLENVFIASGNLKGDVNRLFDAEDNGEIFSKGSKLFEKDGKKYVVFRPTGHVMIRLEGNKPYKIEKHGLVFLIKLDDNNQLITIHHDGQMSDGVRIKKGDYLLTDVYQIDGHTPIDPFLIELCQATSVPLEGTPPPSITDSPCPTMIFPDQNVSDTQKQLQLQWFLCAQQSGIGGGFWQLHCKPAVYLYPEKKQYINVKVKTRGELTYTDPQYPLFGWTTLASPDGSLLVDGKPFDYLYYESKIPDELIDKPSTGFVVQFDKLPELYTMLLPQLGLNEKQTNDFKEYWEKTLPYSPFYFVGILDPVNIDEFEPLDITPNPDTNIRVRLYFEARDYKTDVQPPIIHMPVKKGFTMVEWGGMVKTDKDHPFTCSQ